MLTHTFEVVNDLNIIYSGSIGRNLPVAGISNQIVSVQTHPDPTQPAIVRRQLDFESDGNLFKPFESYSLGQAKDAVPSMGNIFGSQAAGRHAIINTPDGGATGGSRVPNLIPGANPYLRDNLQFLNPAAFSIPEPGTLGNLKRGQLRGPGSYQVDLALTRVLFYKTELASKYFAGADLKIEISNLFNRTNFSNPPATLPNVLGTSDTGNRIQPAVPFTRPAAGPAFGVFTAADAARQIQFSLIFKFNEGF